MLSSDKVREGTSGGARRERRLRRKGGARWGSVVFLLIVCLCIVALVLGDYWINYGKIYRGVSVGSLSLGGKSPEEAREILAEDTDSLEEIQLSGPKKLNLSSEQFDVNFNVEASVDQAYAVGRRGGLGQRLIDRIETAWGTASVPLVVNYDRKRLREGVLEVAAALSAEPVDASFEVDSSGISVKPSRTGQKVNEEKLLADIESGLPQMQREYQVPLYIEEPKLNTEEAEKLKPTALIGSYRTDYRETSDKSPERVENLNIASKAISGTVLAPGEVFSVAEIAAPLEYNETKVIIENKEEKADGGGLCQVSSTLYMAANYAGLESVERHPHDAQLPYIRPGFDATIWFGNSQSERLDMKFKNDTESYLLIREYVADDGFIYAEIWGQPTGKEVEMDSEPEYVGPDYSKWITNKKVTENGKVVLDDIFHKDIYKPLVDEKGKIIRPDSEEVKPAPVNP